MPQFKRIYLIVLLSLVAVATAITVGAIFLGGRPFMYDSILVSAIGVGFMILMSFAALPAMEKRGLQWIAAIGAILAGVMILLLPPVMLWMSSYRYGRAISADERQLRDFLGDMIGTGMVWAAFLCLIAFIYTPRLNLFGKLLQLGTLISMTVATAMFMGVIWFENLDMLRDAENAFLASMVLSVAGVMAVLLVGRFITVKVPDVLSMVGETIHLQCPRCKKFQDLALGSAHCSGCRLRIAVEVEEPRCPKCGYNLHRLTRPICPECGEQISPELAAQGESATSGPAAASVPVGPA